MERLSAGILFLILFSLPLSGRKPVHKSLYHSDSLIINAVLDEWPDTLISDKAGFKYFIMNDSTHLYVCLLLREKEIRRKVQNLGLTLWIDSNGKKKERFGINYPMKRDNIPNQQAQKQNYPDPEKMTDQFRLNESINEKMMLIGFSGKKEEEIAHPKFYDGIKIAVLNDGFAGLYYELSIELRLLTDNPDQFFNASDQYLSVGFETGHINMNAQRPGGSGMKGGGMRGGGGGMPGGGRLGGQRPPGGQGNQERMEMMQSMSQPSRLWIKSVQLTLDR